MQVASLEGRYARREKNVVARDVAGEMVIVDMESGMYHGLNAVGTLIWQALDGEQSLAGIATGLAAQFPDIPAETIEADSLSLMQALLDHGLVAAR